MLGQKQVWAARTSKYIPQILWDVITCPCPWYLLLAQRSSYILLIYIYIYIYICVCVYVCVCVCVGGGGGGGGNSYQRCSVLLMWCHYNLRWPQSIKYNYWIDPYELNKMIYIINYSIRVPGWVLKCLNLITATGSVSNQPGSVTWLATAGISKIHAVSWRNHIENQTTKGAQNM